MNRTDECATVTTVPRGQSARTTRSESHIVKALFSLAHREAGDILAFAVTKAQIIDLCREIGGNITTAKPGGPNVEVRVRVEDENYNIVFVNATREGDEIAIDFQGHAAPDDGQGLYHSFSGITAVLVPSYSQLTNREAVITPGTSGQRGTIIVKAFPQPQPQPQLPRTLPLTLSLL
jgi:hypothetical protein